MLGWRSGRHGRGRPSRAERQFGQQRHTSSGHLDVPGRLRAGCFRLLKKETGIRELELRGHASTVSNVGDLICPRRLLNGAAARLPRGARRHELGPCEPRVEASQFLDLLQPKAAFLDVGTSGKLIAALAAACQNGHLDAGADRPVRSPVVQAGERSQMDTKCDRNSN